MSAPEPPEAPDGIDLQEVLAELDDVGRTKWSLAVATVKNRRLEERLVAQARRIAELENAQQPTGPPSRHPTIPGEDGSPVEVPS